MVDAELARLKGLNDFIETVGGIDLSLFEGMVEHTFNLLESISHNINDSATALAHLMETFNDVEASNWIIYHLRLLASATLKGDPESNLGFITNPGGVPGHCASSIEVPGVEMEQLELNLLVTVLLKPAGLILEVAYLDRSAGSKVNTYRFPDEAQSQDPATLGPVIYVLYRPGHYDLLYRTPVDVSVNAVEVMIDLHNFASSTPTLRGFASANGAVLANIPGCSQMRPGLPVNTGSSEPPPPPPPPPPMDMYSVSNPASPWVLVPNGAGCVASQQPAESPMQNFRMAEQGIQTPTQAVDIYPGPETEAAFPALSTHSAIRPPFPAAKRPGRFDLPFPLHNPVPDLPSAGLPASNDEQPPQQRQPPPTTVALMLSPLQAQGDPMRSSKYNKEYAYTAHNPWRKPPAFGEEPPRQSVWVTKHYRHENFTPEQWVPALDGSGAVVLHAKVSKRYPKAAALRERREREAVEKEKRLRGAR